MIGVMLVGEGFGTHFNKNYLYFAMAFALGVELLNLRVGGRSLASTANSKVVNQSATQLPA